MRLQSSRGLVHRKPYLFYQAFKNPKMVKGIGEADQVNPQRVLSNIGALVIRWWHTG